MPMFPLIALDADDTLWENEIYYRQGRALFDDLLKPYALEGDVDAFVHSLEIRNLEYYGYGAIGFILSLIEAGGKLTGGRFSSRDSAALIEHLKTMLSAEVELLDGAEQVVTELAATHRLILVTKGDFRHQRRKVDRSGLAGYFERVEIVSEKSADVYQGILDANSVEPSDFLMIGNSMRSDILPVLEIGGWAVHVPNELTWVHETLDDIPQENPRFREVVRLEDVPAMVRALEAQRSW
jgi:putative hydrolase of the HAD superfamily